MVKLCRIWETHGGPKAKVRAHDKKRLKCLVKAAKAIHMEFKAAKYKGL
jgi:hypothetical protein